MTEFAPASLHQLPDRGFGPITLSVHEQGDGPAVVFSHGFPELAYSWRHQLPAVAAAGFRTVAPDQRGYGASSAPDPIDAYGIGQLCGDLADLCDAMGIERAVFVGHDWGGAVVWAMPAIHPEKVVGVVGVCTPFMQMPGTDFLKALVDGEIERQYMLWFQEPGVAEAVLDGRARMVFEKLMRGGVEPREFLAGATSGGRVDMNPFLRIEELDPPGEMVATPEEIDHYVHEYERTGFRGGINWYRNIDANAQQHPEVGKADPGVPCLMICAEWDPALPPVLAAGMGDRIADLEMHTIPRAGHWVQQECPDELNSILVDWLVRRFGS